MMHIRQEADPWIILEAAAAIGRGQRGGIGIDMNEGERGASAGAED